MSSHAEYTRELAHAGHAFKVEIFTDDHATPPWANSDGHGPVRRALREDKRLCERVMTPSGSRDYWYLYDWSGAMLLALRDGWRPLIEPRGVQTSRSLAAAAVQADFEYLCGWLRDEWHYVGVCVTHEASGAHASVWGIESTETAYFEEVSRDCAAECMSDIRFTEWKARLADRERALNVADRLDRMAQGLARMISPDLLIESARLLRLLARGAE